MARRWSLVVRRRRMVLPFGTNKRVLGGRRLGGTWRLVLWGLVFLGFLGGAMNEWTRRHDTTRTFLVSGGGYGLRAWSDCEGKVVGFGKRVRKFLRRVDQVFCRSVVGVVEDCKNANRWILEGRRLGIHRVVFQSRRFGVLVFNRKGQKGERVADRDRGAGSRRFLGGAIDDWSPILKIQASDITINHPGRRVQGERSCLGDGPSVGLVDFVGGTTVLGRGMRRIPAWRSAFGTPVEGATIVLLGFRSAWRRRDGTPRGQFACAGGAIWESSPSTTTTRASLVVSTRIATSATTTTTTTTTTAATTTTRGTRTGGTARIRVLLVGAVGCPMVGGTADVTTRLLGLGGRRGEMLNKGVQLSRRVVAGGGKFGVLVVTSRWPIAVAQSLTILVFSELADLAKAKAKVVQVIVRSCLVGHEAFLFQSLVQFGLDLHQLKAILIVPIGHEELLENRGIQLVVEEVGGVQRSGAAGNGESHFSNVLTGVLFRVLGLVLGFYTSEFSHGVTLDDLNEHHPEEGKVRFIGHAFFHFETKLRSQAIQQCETSAAIV